VTSSEGSQQPGGLFENLIEVLFSPSKVFDRTRNSKAFMYALVTALVVGVVLFLTKNLLQPWFEAQADVAIAQAAAKGTPMPDQAVGAMRGFMMWGFLGTAVVAALVGPYINALFLMMGGKLASARLTYGQAAMIAVLGGVPRLLSYLLMSAQTVLLDSGNAKGLTDLALGPARFVDPVTTSPAVVAMLSSVDVTRVWQVILTAIGVSVVARVSAGAGFVAALIMVCIGMILQLIPTAFA
jgi:hypothetical protein